MRRRLFLLGGAALAGMGAATMTSRHVWRGHAFGAEATIALDGGDAKRAIAAARAEIERLERLFSLYDPGSALSRLNREGSLRMPTAFAELIGVVDRVHVATGGLFDPTVQPLFAAMLRRGGALDDAERGALRGRTGWRHVRVRGDRIAFDRPGMALTLNGIAQGFASDRVSAVLAAHGHGGAFVDIGEPRANGVARVRVDGEAVRLRGGAIATTAASGFRFSDGTSHLLAPHESLAPRWATVAVEAASAAVADGLSTALALTADDRMAGRLVADGMARRVWLDGEAVKGA